MAVRTDSPKIAELRAAVERRFGNTIETRANFSRLASEVERITKEHLAENTLRRMWGKLDSYATVYTRTLDVLSRYIGYRHWNAFCDALVDGCLNESSAAMDTHSIKVEDLTPGDRIRIGWLPDRVCIVEYQGGHIFKAIDCVNSTLQIGDSFECSVMIKHCPLFVDNLVHGGELCQRYSMGLDNGLTTLEQI